MFMILLSGTRSVSWAEVVLPLAATGGFFAVAVIDIASGLSNVSPKKVFAFFKVRTRLSCGSGGL